MKFKFVEVIKIPGKSSPTGEDVSILVSEAVKKYGKGNVRVYISTGVDKGGWDFQYLKICCYSSTL